MRGHHAIAARLDGIDLNGPVGGGSGGGLFCQEGA